MPTNDQGIYTPPPSNPVQPGTLVEADWANETVNDIAQALTDRLPRNGSAPMTGPLILHSTNNTQPREAASVAFVQRFVSIATGLPVGAMFPYAGANNPGGCLLCNGQAVSRTVYAALFAEIGTIYGSGDNATTFNVPDARKIFFRGRGDGQQLGAKVAQAVASHSHPLNDPGHAHGASIPNHAHGISDPGHGHSASQGSHSHGVNDPGHAHGIQGQQSGGGEFRYAVPTATGQYLNSSVPTNVVGTGISIAAAAAGAISIGGSGTGISVAQTALSASIAAAFTGVTIGAAGEAEGYPAHMVVDYYIKALNDSPGSASVMGIVSSDPAMITIDAADPVFPVLDIKSNVAFGTVKLNADGKVPPELMSFEGADYLGIWDASTGQNPTEAYPAVTFKDGDFYQVSVGGTIAVADATGTIAMRFVDVGGTISFLSDSPTLPVDRWYYVSNVGSFEVVKTGDTGSAVMPVGTTAQRDTTPSVGFTRFNNELDALEVYKSTGWEEVGKAFDGVAQTSVTGSAVMPSGTTAERDPAPELGYTRFNEETDSLEVYKAAGWEDVGAGGSDQPFDWCTLHKTTVTESAVIPAGYNAVTAGPIEIADGVTVEVPDGSTWSIV